MWKHGLFKHPRRPCPTQLLFSTRASRLKTLVVQRAPFLLILVIRCACLSRCLAKFTLLSLTPTMSSLAVLVIVCAALLAGVEAEPGDNALSSELQACPASCRGSPQLWTVYGSLERLESCSGPMLLDFSIHNALDNPEAVVKIRACEANAFLEQEARSPGTCFRGSGTKAVFELATGGDKTSADTKPVLRALGDHLGDRAHCDERLFFGLGRRVAIGIHSGASIDNSAASTILDALLGQMAGGNLRQKMTLQLCGKDRSADHTFGVMVDTTGDLAAVQKAVRSWANATCVDMAYGAASQLDIDIVERPTPSKSDAATSGKSDFKLQARGDCRIEVVWRGSDCPSLARKCGISPQDFTRFNPKADLCSSLAEGQRICCSSGTLPDIRPKPSPDGTCAAYTVGSDDWCLKIAAANDLKVEDIERFNDKTTWGWFGCDNLLSGTKICLSEGKPPLPAPVPNAVCGPLKPGTRLPDSDTNIADLNPCPLNACCNIWGQCGITPDFCTAEKGPRGNPGTAPVKKNGCISHCGTDVANNGAGPDQFMSIGYYEAFNWGRPCLNMRAARLQKADYTHIHWAFGDISPDLSVSVNDSAKQWDDFRKLPQKKIISFGGWAFSTEPATYDIFRRAVEPGNRRRFIDNVVKMVVDNGLDGVDFDWEYPGAPDIPGTPPGLPTDGPNYLAFLQAMRASLPKGASLSMAAPASFWYLRAFPIDKMAEEVDYIVYMTYDLHGQWDYGNSWAQEGCREGNCLRSHVNLTETGYALAMITKAGVKSNKVAVGIASYGRSFGMSKPGCTDPDCHFDGAVDAGRGASSTAKPGRCTKTAGYIANAELREKLAQQETGARTWYDRGSDSNLMVYDNSSWVAYMDGDTRVSRTRHYRNLNFAGTVDWAVDLLDFSSDDGNPGGYDAEEWKDVPGLEPCDKTYGSLDDVAADGGIRPHCVDLYVLQALRSIYKDTMKSYTDMLNKDYAAKFDVYSHAVADHISKTMHDFIIKNGNKYFTCEVGELSVCCDECQQYAGSCPYCFKEGKCYSRYCGPDLEAPCLDSREMFSRRGIEGVVGPAPTSWKSNALVRRQRQLAIKQVRAAEPCPPDYSKHGYGYLPTDGSPPEGSIWWTLVKEDEFYAALLQETGVPKAKTAIGHYTRADTCPNGFPGADSEQGCAYLGYDYNIPVPDHYTAADVKNPKQIVEKAQEKSKNLDGDMEEVMAQIKADLFDGKVDEVVDSVSMPVLILQEAVHQMSQVVKAADEMTEAKRKAIIMAFIGAILFLVPVAGEALGTVAELADVAALVLVVGEAGNVAFDMYSLVEDADNGPLAILGIVLSPLALMRAGDMSRAAKYRRGMSAADVSKMGARVSGSLNTISSIRKRACRARV
ncbi:hypothetical protein L249_6131 [Ophiocordyceps polyrhachis-furcata BCC 54312]|uniref:chitinase n=1 Tax=Ophiocordyceps polyrhachis-furcata BCC 54312 TaxID=1330021 RepID=A0A367LJ42_9HYPO|nr:hypothetical protein L249_6131 [Ophiocordyceps polyrhachis-furcata BCC 54312]